MNTTKIVFIGAGSMFFGLNMFRDMFSTKELSGSKLVLVDLNEPSLERMYQLALKMNAESGAGMIIEKTTDRLVALPGAGFVVNSIAIDRNRGTIQNLPYDCAVEVPIAVDGTGVHPLSIGKIPEALTGLLTTQAVVQKFSVEAAVHGSKEMALQALLVDPVVNSISAAEKLLDELWEVNKPYIRACI